MTDIWSNMPFAFFCYHFCAADLLFIAFCQTSSSSVQLLLFFSVLFFPFVSCPCPPSTNLATVIFLDVLNYPLSPVSSPLFFPCNCLLLLHLFSVCIALLQSPVTSQTNRQLAPAKMAPSPCPTPSSPALQTPSSSSSTSCPALRPVRYSFYSNLILFCCNAFSSLQFFVLVLMLSIHCTLEEIP